MQKLEKTVYPIHFEDRSGKEFERLVLAYVANIKKWKSIDWHGQAGKDSGRDIWAEDEDDTYCYQCANYQKLSFRKAKDDIDKLLVTPNHHFFVCGGVVSANMKQKIIDYACKKGSVSSKVWSGVELEEMIRRDCPHLIERFVGGNPFPDSVSDLVTLVKDIGNLNDNEILDLLFECFDRPAFTTPFRNEVSIPDFAKAIDDTVEVLNTGIHRLRDGMIVRKIPSRHQITDLKMKVKIDTIYQSVIDLRSVFNKLKQSNDIRHCSCSDKDCPVWILSHKASREMDMARREIFRRFGEINIKYYSKRLL